MSKFKLNIFNYILLFFASFPLIPNSIKGLPVVLLLFASFLFINKREIKNWKWFLLNSSVFFLYLISLIYTENISYAGKIIERSLSFLVIPLVFFIVAPSFEVTKKLKHDFINIFIYSTLGFSITTLVFIVSDNKTQYYGDFYSNKFRIIVENIPYIGQHPTYASIYLGLSIIFISYALITKSFNDKIIKLIVITSGVINLIVLILLSSKGVILSLMLLFILYSIKLIFKNNNIKRGLIMLILVILSMSALFIFNRRMSELTQKDTFVALNSNYSNSIRYNVYKCFFIVSEERPIFGFGVGDFQSKLNECYKDNNASFLLKKTYNTHNQYFDFAIKLGLIGLIVFLLMLILNCSYSLNNKNYLLLFVLLFYIINFLTENILVRQSGIILFFFLIHFLRDDRQYDKLIKIQ